jgi:hypothetical protein
VPGSSLWCWDGSLVAVVSFAGAATETCRFNHVGSGSRPGLEYVGPVKRVGIESSQGTYEGP